jgi:uncharacterized membrane protein HdeD (DUF308 family)
MFREQDQFDASGDDCRTMPNRDGRTPDRTARGIILFAGLLGVAAAVVTVLMPAITVLVLTILAAVLLIGVGVAEIVIAVRAEETYPWRGLFGHFPVR